MNDLPLIDRSVFDELKDTAGAEFVTELVGTFLEEAPAMLAEVRAAAASGDETGLKRTAHSLKSNARTFGAQALGEAARAIELGGLGAADAPALDALDRQFQRAAAALQELCRG